MERLLAVLMVLSIALLLIVLRSLRREHIRVEHSVSWLAACAALIGLSCSHTFLDWLAVKLGLSEPGVGLLFLILIVFLGVFYRFSRAVSGLKDMNITLTQRMAILEYKLREKNEEQ